MRIVTIYLLCVGIFVPVFCHMEESHNEFAEFEDEQSVELREPVDRFHQAQVVIKDPPVLRVEFCVSCGYRQTFELMGGHVHQKYPTMEILGENYSPGPWPSYLAQFCSIVKIGIIALIISGSNPLQYFGMDNLQALKWAQANKISSCLMVFSLSNMIEGSLLATGAFEIFLAEELLWSKLESGRVPNPEELINIIDSHLRLIGKIPVDDRVFENNF